MIHGRQHGVSLIEALVAMGVMAFGMLAVVGLQVTLRTNGDVSKQRAEAVRIAQQSIEAWRAFVAVEARPGLDYQELISDPAAVNVPGINATYARTRTITVSPGGSPPMKTLAVAVNWVDRSGETQSVLLNSVIAGVGPELAGSLAVPTNGTAGRQPQSRHRGIPALAKDLLNGTSAIKPPGAPGDVAWRFDNLTGLITLCSVDPSVLQTSDLTLVNLNCGAQNALGVSGFVRYVLPAIPPPPPPPPPPPAPPPPPPSLPAPLEADARNPTSGPINSLAVSVTRTDGGLAPICYVQPVVGSSPYTRYNCAVPVTVNAQNPTPGWSGSVSITVDPAAFLIAAALTEKSASMIKVCSYANPGAVVGTAAFSGGGNSITLTPRAGGNFRAWAAGSRIDLYYGDWTYAYTVGAAVAVVPGQVLQTVAVNQPLPGAGPGLDALAFADVWPYANVSVPLFNNNYLVIRAGDSGVAPAASEVAFSCPVSTIAHQPSS